MVRGILDYTFSRWELDGGYPLPACWRVLEIAGVLFYRVLARVGNCPCWKGEGGGTLPPKKFINPGKDKQGAVLGYRHVL